jgi:hypothetical protein
MAKRGRKGKGQRTAPPQGAHVDSAPTTSAAAHPAAADSAKLADAAHAQTPAAAPTPAGARESRALANALIAAFLLFQIAMPLRYYLGGRGYDERFSWRMFSSVRMQRCAVQVHETAGDGSERKLNLEQELQVAWIGMLERYRAGVVEELLRKRCASGGAREVRYARSCQDPGGNELPQIHARLDCARNVLSVEERAR